MAYLPPLNGGRINATIGGNTAGAGALVSSGTMLLVGGNNITLSQAGSNISIVGANAPAGSVNFSAGTTSNNLSAVTFSNSNNVNFGLNGSVITASVSSSLTNINLSAGTTSANLSKVTFGDANGVSFGLNTANSSITASHNALTSQSNQALSGSNGSFTFQTASFGTLNGVSFYTSNGSVVASHNALTSQSNQALSGSNGSFAFQTATFGSSNGMHFYTTNGSLVGSYTVPTQTNQTLSQAVTGNTTGNTSGMSVDARSLTLQGLGAASVGISTSAGGSSIIISAPTNYITTARASNDAIGLNTAKTNATWTVNSSGLSLNAAGYAGTGFSGTNATATLNSNGLQLSVGAGGGGGGIALANSITTYTSGTANLVVATGAALTIASTTGQSYVFSVPGTSSLSATGIVSISTNGGTINIGAPAMFDAGISNLGNTSGTSGINSNGLVLAGGNNITLSQATGAGGNTITISGAAGGGGGGATGLYFDNMFQQNSIQGISYTSVSTAMFGRVILQPLAPGNELFPYHITATVMRLGFSNGGATSQSASFGSTFWFGLYTRVNSTQLSIVNSASTSFGLGVNANNSASFAGARWMSIHSSQFSAAITLDADSRYFFGILVRTAGSSYGSISLAGMHLGHSVQRSGYMAAAVTSGTSFNAWHPFMGVHSLTTHTALPASIANSDINKASLYANFIPQVIFDAGLGQIN